MPAFLTVEKICDPTDDDGTFEIKVDGETVSDVDECGETSATIVIQIPSTDTDGVVEATVSETDPGSNYETPVIGGDCAADGTVSLESGDEKHCTVTNTRIICPEVDECGSFSCGTTSCDPEGAPNNCDIITYSSSTTNCRTGSGDICDPDESCTGTSLDCPADVIASASTICNPGSGDVCDPDESCTGVAGEACPSDSVASASTICNPGSGDICDPDESCTGTAGEACPSDTVASASTICNPGSGDICDPDESCTGTADEACPSDTVASASTICNPGSGDICDPDESCTGTADEACPSDTVASASTICNAGSGDICDPDESCTGVADESCPTDVVASATTICREGTASACDPDDSCTGVAGEACPTHEPEFCPTGEGCSPGFWRTHTELWDGVGDDDVTDTITTETLWDDDLGIPSCDGVNLTTPPNDELGDTIVLKKNSSNTLFHFTACLIGADSIDGFAFQDLNALIADMQFACAEGGEALAELREACTAANFHDEITVFCPFN
jgi:hypothetical protein